MPVIQNYKRYISLFLALFLIVLAMFGIFIDVKCLDDHPPVSSIIFPIHAHCMEITSLIRDGRKDVCQFISAGFYDSLSMQAYCADISKNKSFYPAALSDHRKEITQAIPHYFHGSKYKINAFLI